METVKTILQIIGALSITASVFVIGSALIFRKRSFSEEEERDLEEEYNALKTRRNGRQEQ